MDKLNDKLMIVSKSLCLLIALVSSIVLFGWITKTDSLIRLNPQMIPMQFNTALCFLLSAVGIFGILFNQVKHLRKIAVIVAIFSMVALIEYVFHLNLGLDEFFVKHYLQTDLVSHPGRMAPNTAICFLFTSFYLFNFNRVSNRFIEINRTVACLILGTAAVALIGYLFGMPTAYGWQNLTGMALSTSISFLIIAMVILIMLSTQSNNSSFYTTPLLFLIIFVTAILWQAISAAYEPTDFQSIKPNLILYSGMVCSLVLICFSYLNKNKTESNTHFGQYFALVILSIGTISSISLYSFLTNQNTVLMEDKLQSSAESNVNTIQSTVDTLNAMLNNVRVIAYYNKNESVAIFENISALFIDKYPSVTRIMYVPVVTDRSKFENTMTDHYKFDVGISEMIGEVKSRSAEYDVYTPVMFQYPAGRMDNDIGLNLRTNEDYREAIANSFDKDNISHRIIETESTGKVMPLQGVVFAPIRNSIYQKQYQIKQLTDINGFIILEYNFGRMITKVINDTLHPSGLHLLIEEESSSDFAMFHQSRLSNDKNIQVGALSHIKPIVLPLHIADEKLTVKVWPSDAFLENYDSYTPETLAIILFLSTLIISAYQFKTTRRELRIEQIKAYLAAVVDSLPSPVLIQDEQLKFTECNQGFATIFGLKKEDVQSQEFFTAIARLPDFSRFRLEDEFCMLTGESKSSQLVIKLSTGEEKTFSYLRNVVQINNVKRLIGTLSDLTSEKKIAEDLNNALINSNEMFNSAPDAMLIVNDLGLISQINSAAERLFGYQPADLINRPVEVLIPADIRKKHVNLRDSFINENISRPMGTGMSLVAINQSGTEIPVEVSLSPIKTSEGVQVVASIRDVSERKAYENAIKTAKNEAENANRSKSDFLANMSHEIRTPMNAIIGFSHLVLDSSLNKDQQKYIHKIQTSANSLLGIINDILDFSKIEARKLEIELIPFNLYIDVLENISNIISLKAGEKQLELLFDFDTDLPANLIGDPLRIGQVLLNLLNNAVKFTEYGEVSLSIKAVQQSDNRVTLRFNVRDSGIGMSTEQVEQLFIPFTQADSSTTRNYGGTGLGLSICDKLVVMMGGNIGVNSIQQQGSSFWFELDFAIDTNKLQEDENLFIDKHLNVLIVDDNPSSLMIIQSYIESFGFYAEVESSAVKALDRLTESETVFDLIITDWKMPGMDGLEFVKQVQHGDMSNAPQVIMVSAFDRDTISAHSQDVDLSDIMTKPITPSSLLDSIANALGGQRIIKPSYIGVSQQYDLSGLNILLAEDNETNQELAYALLNKVGAKVTIAENGQKAIELIESHNIDENGSNQAKTEFDLVLMDIQMPILDGISATKLLRQNPRLIDLPIIAMTANALNGDREISVDAGMNDHLNKPINVKELYTTILKWTKPTSGLMTQGVEKSINVSHQGLYDSLNLLGIQCEQALQRLNHDQQLYLSILQKFAERAVEDTTALKQILSDNKTDDEMDKSYLALSSQIHSLKGILGNIGAAALVQQCHDIEAELKLSRFPLQVIEHFSLNLASLSESIKDIFNITIHDLNITEKHINTDKMVATLTEEQYSAYLSQLSELLYNNDTESIDILKQLIESCEPPVTELVAMLIACEKYDFDSAEALFNEFMKS